jgi:hypothetical protein
LILLTVVWMVISAAVPGSAAAGPVYDAVCAPEPARAILTDDSGDEPSPFVGSTASVKEITTQDGSPSRSPRERTGDNAPSGTSVAVSLLQARVAALAYLDYGRAIASATAGLTSWHSTAPPPLS